MAITSFQTNLLLSDAANVKEEERIANEPQVGEEERFVHDPKEHESNEDYEDWVHEQNMDAEFNTVDYYTSKNRKMAQNVRDKKLTRPKQDQPQKELYMQKIKEMAAAKKLKNQKTKERRTEDKLRVLERKDKQDVKDIGLDENQYDKDNCGEVNSWLVKENWDDGLWDDDY